jgi:hypothetical protein
MLSKGTVSGSILPYEIAPAVKMQDLTDHFTTLAPPQPRLSTARWQGGAMRGWDEAASESDMGTPSIVVDSRA